MGMLAIIPARSGSKGLKDKNIKPLNGKPLLSYSIEAALKSELFDCVHVSTDSEEYAKIGREYGADIPFLRSAEMSSDTASSWDTVLEALERYETLGKRFDTVALLQPTSPLRTADDIVKAYEMYRAKNAKAVVSVCEMEHSPLWCNTLPEDCSMEFFEKRESDVSRQALQTYYRINGAVYIVDVDFLRADTFIYRKGCYAYVMDGRSSVDIDTQLDFDIAEIILKKQT